MIKCEKCDENNLKLNHQLQEYVQALKDIYRHLDNLEYVCESSIYTVDEDEMSWIFYCRDHAWKTLQKFNKS